MTPDWIAPLERQLTRFQACRTAAMVSPPDAPIAPKDALLLAEYLLLCPTEDSATRYMRMNPEQTKAFERLATVFLKLAKSGIAERIQPDPGGILFFDLASAVQEYAEMLLSNYSDEFERD